MADGITLSAGTADGAKIATDDQGASGHVQYIKPMFGGDGTFTIVTSSVGLPVDVLTIAAGDNNIGNVDIVSGVITTVSALGIGTTGPQKAEDVASQDGDMGIAMLAIRDDTLNIRSGSEGDYEFLHTNANGALWTEMVNATVAVTQSGTWDEVGINDSGNSITVDQATGTNLHMVVDSGTVTTVSTVTAVTTLTGSGVAHDAGDSGNPHKIGGKAIDIGTQPTAVTGNDRTDWYFNRNGVPWVLGGSPAILTKELNVTDADGAQTDTALVTVSAGTAIVVTAFQAMADHANTVDVGFRCGFGTANTPSADAAGIIASHPGLAAGSGVVIGNGGGAIGMGASNEDLRVTCEDPVTGAVNFIVHYFTILIG